MKYLILLPFLFLAACGDTNSFTSTGSGSIITDGSSGTTVEQPPAVAAVAPESAEGNVIGCSDESAAAGRCVQ